MQHQVEGLTRAWPWLALAAGVVALDQLTKWWVSTSLAVYESIPILPFFNLVHVHNTGAAFSFLAQAGGWQRWLFTGLALLISVVIVAWLIRLSPRQRLQALGLALILGGALGNAWDRLTLGYVVDFLDVYYQTWHWPAFNVADSAITVGVATLIVEAIWFADRPDQVQ